jgi:ssDNA-binding Zn-finger/Zn-ribbon topoisomerase 1
MDIKPITVSLKSNPSITYNINVKECICGMPMFLRKSHNGKIFWSCKNFHNNKNLRKCDHTKDVKCFRCESWRINNQKE